MMTDKVVPTPERVEKAVTAFKFCLSFIKDGCLWSTGSLDSPHITTTNLKDVMAYIAELEAKVKQEQEGTELVTGIMLRECAKVNDLRSVNLTLASENTRLAEALMFYCPNGNTPDEYAARMREDHGSRALAQTGGK